MGKEATLSDISSEGNALTKLHLLQVYLKKQKVGHLMTTTFGYYNVPKRNGRLGPAESTSEFMDLEIWGEEAGWKRHRHKTDEFIKEREVFVGACSHALGSQFDALWNDDEDIQNNTLPYQMWDQIKRYLNSEHYAQVPRIKDDYDRSTLEKFDGNMKLYLDNLVDLKKTLNGYKEKDYCVSDMQAIQKSISGINGANDQDNPYFFTCNDVQNRIETDRCAIAHARANKLPVPKMSMTFLTVQNLVLTRYKEL